MPSSSVNEIPLVFMENMDIGEWQYLIIICYLAFYL